MLYLWYLSSMGWQPRYYAPESPLFRATLAVLLAFLVVWALGPLVIRTLRRFNIDDQPEFDHDALNRANQEKAKTPTMGGLLIAVAIFVAVFLLADVRNFYIVLGLFCLIWLAALGGVDDWLKLTFKRRGGKRDGLYMWEKLVFQVALGVLLALFIYRYGQAKLEDAQWGADLEAHYRANYNLLTLPFNKHPLALPTGAFIIIAIVVIAGTSNAVNLTDGMDGLASGCMVLTAGAFMVFAYVVGRVELADRLLFPYIRDADELAILCGAVVGACLGFMWYNACPAQMFMGDTGSLPLGGLMGYVAIVTRLELMLFIVGGVFVIEALSVLLQVSFYKATGGKRIFRCSPLHHHFHLGGLQESQVVMRFWLLAALFAAFALLTIKLR